MAVSVRVRATSTRQNVGEARAAAVKAPFGASEAIEMGRDAVLHVWRKGAAGARVFV